jgi:hypothetical protein
VLASANRSEVDAPEAGSFIAVPVAYPGDRVAARSARVVRKPVAKVSATTGKPASTQPVAAKAAATQPVSTKTATVHPVAINSAAGRPAAAHPAVAHPAPSVAQRKPAVKPVTKNISKAPQTKPAARS